MISAQDQARLAQASLEAEGIEAVIADENVGSLYGAGVVGGVKLRVREEDVARATELLATQRPIPEIYLVTEEDARRPRCPTCRCPAGPTSRAPSPRGPDPRSATTPNCSSSSP